MNLSELKFRGYDPLINGYEPNRETYQEFKKNARSICIKMRESLAFKVARDSGVGKGYECLSRERDGKITYIRPDEYRVEVSGIVSEIVADPIKELSRILKLMFK